MEQDLVFSPDGSGIPVTQWRDTADSRKKLLKKLPFAFATEDRSFEKRDGGFVFG